MTMPTLVTATPASTRGTGSDRRPLPVQGDPAAFGSALSAALDEPAAHREDDVSARRDNGSARRDGGLPRRDDAEIGRGLRDYCEDVAAVLRRARAALRPCRR